MLRLLLTTDNERADSAWVKEAAASGRQAAARKFMSGSMSSPEAESVGSDGATFNQWLPSSQPQVREASGSVEWEAESDTSSVTRAKKLRLKSNNSDANGATKANTKFLGLF